MNKIVNMRTCWGVKSFTPGSTAQAVFLLVQPSCSVKSIYFLLSFIFTFLFHSMANATIQTLEIEFYMHMRIHMCTHIHILTNIYIHAYICTFLTPALHASTHTHVQGLDEIMETPRILVS